MVSEGEYGVRKAEVTALGAAAEVEDKEVVQDLSSHTGATNKFKGASGKVVQSSLKQFFHSKERTGNVSGSKKKEPEAKPDTAAADESNKLSKKPADGIG